MSETKMSKEEGKIEYSGKEDASERIIPEKVKRKIAKKVAACVSAGIVVSSAGFVVLGETGNLPGEVQEWYDETSQPIRKMFGIEEANEELTHLVSEAEPEKFTGLEIEGLNHVWQNNRWEYVDPNDNLVAGFWNEKEGKYEHTADVLKGEWEGLFVSQSLEEVRSELKEDKEWTKENWNNGEIKVPIGFDITKGGVVEEIKALGNVIQGTGAGTVIGIKDLPSGTIVFSPFPSLDETGPSFGWSDNSANFNIDKDSILFSFTFRNTSQCLIPGNGYPDNPYNGSEYAGKEYPFVLGYPVLEVNNNDILPRMPKVATSIVNPFIKENCQVLISANKQEGGLISFSLKNFLQDEKGRFIFISPSSKEIEVMKNTIEKEIKIATLEADKKALEEKLEKSSIIDQEKKAPNIEGLEFDKDSGFYIAKKNNKYGLVEEEKAGAFIDGFLSLKPAVIKSLQNETERYSFPIPINPAEGKIKIAETVDKITRNTVLLIDLSEEMSVYSPKEAFFYQYEQHGGEQGSEGLAFILPNKMGETRELEIRSNKFEYLVDDDVNIDVGVLLAKTDQDIFYELYLGGRSVDIMNYILKIDDIPVFILPNE